MERFNVIQDIAIQLGLEQVENSWIKTLGIYLEIEQEEGPDDYEQRVFTAAIANNEVNIPINPLLITRRDGVDFNDQTAVYNFTGNGVSLLNTGGDIVNINIPGIGLEPKYHFIGMVDINYGSVSWRSRKPGTNTPGPSLNKVGYSYPLIIVEPTLTRVSKGHVRIEWPGAGSPFTFGYSLLKVSWNNTEGATHWAFHNYADLTTQASVDLYTQIMSLTPTAHFDGYNTGTLMNADYTGWVTIELIRYPSHLD